MKAQCKQYILKEYHSNLKNNYIIGENDPFSE